METLGCTNFDWLFRQTALSDFTLVIRPTSSRSDDALPEQSNGETQARTAGRASKRRRRTAGVESKATEVGRAAAAATTVGTVRARSRMTQRGGVAHASSVQQDPDSSVQYRTRLRTRSSARLTPPDARQHSKSANPTVLLLEQQQQQLLLQQSQEEEEEEQQQQQQQDGDDDDEEEEQQQEQHSNCL